ncbi:DUF6261 family protein [Ancylomarina longa]|uniref:Uncharacterized protein n=1 Tax=Ancylomarina longa TaxID=2487017 RepID=A0A434ATC0_9BACT|nr:DUF6261 family protein [Ancylomarina longa]RUT77671.1 hypothetical protein DLK05_12145 [Ancylomarina longa]
MNTQIYYYCNNEEINSALENLLPEFKKANFGEDLVLSGILDKIKYRNTGLRNTMGIVRKGKFTNEMHLADSKLDKTFICFKQIVNANTYFLDEDIASSARKLWEVIEAYDLNMYMYSYERQLSKTLALIERTKEDEISNWIGKIEGGERALNQMEICCADYQLVYNKTIQEDANTVTAEAPTAQKKEIRDLINRELLPYLNVMSQAMPQKYAAITELSRKYIKEINRDAHARKTRKKAQVQKENL